MICKHNIIAKKLKKCTYGDNKHITYISTTTTTGCLQMQPYKFPDFQDIFNKVPVDILRWSSLRIFEFWHNYHSILRQFTIFQQKHSQTNVGCFVTIHTSPTADRQRNIGLSYDFFRSNKKIPGDFQELSTPCTILALALSTCKRFVDLLKN